MMRLPYYKKSAHYMLRIAHRGHSEKHGDNNMQSFLAAQESGFDMIELDVQLCKTGEIVVFHDLYLNDKCIKDLTLSELRREKIITLQEFFEKVDIDKIKFFLDIKGSSEIILSLTKMLKGHFTPAQLQRVYISGFGRHFVQPLKDANLPVKIGFTTENNFTPEQLVYLTKGLHFVCVHWVSLDVRSIKAMHELDIEVFSYTCKDDLSLQHMKSFSLDGIVTDYPLTGSVPPGPNLIYN